MDSMRCVRLDVWHPTDVVSGDRMDLALMVFRSSWIYAHCVFLRMWWAFAFSFATSRRVK